MTVTQKQLAIFKELKTLEEVIYERDTHIKKMEALSIKPYHAGCMAILELNGGYFFSCYGLTSKLKEIGFTIAKTELIHGRG